MNNRTEIRFAGSGGQGLILASIILAEAALNDSLYAAQSQSYGPEARGGMCKAELVIDHGEIDYPKVENADCLLALNQTSFDKYAGDTSASGVVLADSSINIQSGSSSRKTVSIDMIKTAAQTVGNPVTANIVALGALNALLDIVSPESLEAAVLKYVPKKTQELNIRALREGGRLISQDKSGE